MHRKKVHNTIDGLNIFASAFLILLLIIVLVGALEFWRDSYFISLQNDVPVQNLMFSLAILVVIVTVFAQWIEGRTKAIVNHIKNIRGGNQWQKKKRNPRK